MNQEELKEILHYNPETGIFTWRKYKKGCRKNLVAGTKTSKGYIRIKLNDSIPVMAHRLAFLYIKGWMPEEVDHEDHVRDNNKWKNLGESSSAANSRNLSLNRNNKLKITGVYFLEETDVFVARIHNVFQIHIGTFIDFFEACCARNSAENKYGYHANHGK